MQELKKRKWIYRLWLSQKYNWHWSKQETAEHRPFHHFLSVFCQLQMKNNNMMTQTCQHKPSEFEHCIRGWTLYTVYIYKSRYKQPFQNKATGTDLRLISAVEYLVTYRLSTASILLDWGAPWLLVTIVHFIVCDLYLWASLLHHTLMTHIISYIKSKIQSHQVHPLTLFTWSVYSYFCHLFFNLKMMLQAGSQTGTGGIVCWAGVQWVGVNYANVCSDTNLD